MYIRIKIQSAQLTNKNRGLYPLPDLIINIILFQGRVLFLDLKLPVYFTLTNDICSGTFRAKIE